MHIRGRALKYYDNVDTDVIIPGKFLVHTDSGELAKHAMQGLDPTFVQRIVTTGLIVAGRNFGCGSSREQAVIALKQSGVRCIIAASFARIFYRNAINTGLPVLECNSILEKVDEGNELSIDLKTGLIKNISKGTEFRTKTIPDFMLDIVSIGLVEYIKKRRKRL